MKFCLSLIYDLPVVEFPTPEFWRSFLVDQYDALGSLHLAFAIGLISMDGRVAAGSPRSDRGNPVKDCRPA
jgi:hypothetical protein